MTEDGRLERLVRESLGDGGVGQAPGRDLWPLVLSRSRQADWSPLDLGLAALLLALLLMRPGWLALLAFHL